MNLDFKNRIDRSWSLFLDRDGVINIEKEGDYIRNWNEFRFIEGSLEAISHFTGLFGQIFVVTNQKGVGKGLMTEDDLAGINRGMLEAIARAGGHVTRIYYCTAVDDSDPCRKPNNGMALRAREDFPSIDLRNALMVGNTMSDMRFGRSSGMYTVFIPSAKPMPELPHPLVDAVFPDLLALAKAL